MDGLRLVAALAVVLMHFFGMQHSTKVWGEVPAKFAPRVHDASLYGFLGVEYFFLISGFVICMSCWGRSPKEFFVSRIARLYPAYWFAVLATALMLMILPIRGWNASVDVGPREIMANLTMVPGALHVGLIDGVAWTLWTEARFYLLMGLILVRGLTYKRLLVFCGFWLMISITSVQLRSTVMGEFLISDYSALFVAGIAIYLMRRFGPNLVLWGLLGFAWCVEMTMLHTRLAGRYDSAGKPLSWTVAAGLLTLGLVLLLLVAIGPLDRIRWRWLTTAGALTYPLYLVHQSIGVPMLIEMHRHFAVLGRPAILGIVLATMLLLSYAIHRLVERPLGRLLKRRLTAGVAARPERA